MITATQYTGAAGSANQAGSRATGNQLDRDAFLRLLITQLRSQDPLKPMEDKDFIAQLAQFSSLEQMQNMNLTLSAFANDHFAFQSAQLIGREVSGMDADTGEKFTGRVESVYLNSDTPLVKVNGKELPVGWITSIS